VKVARADCTGDRTFPPPANAIRMTALSEAYRTIPTPATAITLPHLLANAIALSHPSANAIALPHTTRRSHYLTQPGDRTTVSLTNAICYCQHALHNLHLQSANILSNTARLILKFISINL